MRAVRRVLALLGVILLFAACDPAGGLTDPTGDQNHYPAYAGQPKFAGADITHVDFAFSGGKWKVTVKTNGAQTALGTSDCWIRSAKLSDWGYTDSVLYAFRYNNSTSAAGDWATDFNYRSDCDDFDAGTIYIQGTNEIRTCTNVATHNPSAATLVGTFDPSCFPGVKCLSAWVSVSAWHGATGTSLDHGDSDDAGWVPKVCRP